MLEETGLAVKNTFVVAIRNVVVKADNYHYVVIYTLAECKNSDDEPETRFFLLFYNFLFDF